MADQHLDNASPGYPAVSRQSHQNQEYDQSKDHHGSQPGLSSHNRLDEPEDEPLLWSDQETELGSVFYDDQQLNVTAENANADNPKSHEPQAFPISPDGWHPQRPLQAETQSQLQYPTEQIGTEQDPASVVEPMFRPEDGLQIKMDSHNDAGTPVSDNPASSNNAWTGTEITLESHTFTETQPQSSLAQSVHQDVSAAPKDLPEAQDVLPSSRSGSEFFEKYREPPSTKQPQPTSEITGDWSQAPTQAHIEAVPLRTQLESQSQSLRTASAAKESATPKTLQSSDSHSQDANPSGTGELDLDLDMDDDFLDENEDVSVFPLEGNATQSEMVAPSEQSTTSRPASLVINFSDDDEFLSDDAEHGQAEPSAVPQAPATIDSQAALTTPSDVVPDAPRETPANMGRRAISRFNTENTGFDLPLEVISKKRAVKHAAPIVTAVRPLQLSPHSFVKTHGHRPSLGALQRSPSRRAASALDPPQRPEQGASILQSSPVLRPHSGSHNRQLHNPYAPSGQTQVHSNPYAPSPSPILSVSAKQAGRASSSRYTPQAEELQGADHKTGNSSAFGGQSRQLSGISRDSTPLNPGPIKYGSESPDSALKKLEKTRPKNADPFGFPGLNAPRQTRAARAHTPKLPASVPRRGSNARQPDKIGPPPISTQLVASPLTPVAPPEPPAQATAPSSFNGLPPYMADPPNRAIQTNKSIYAPRVRVTSKPKAPYNPTSHTAAPQAANPMPQPGGATQGIGPNPAYASHPVPQQQQAQFNGQPQSASLQNTANLSHPGISGPYSNRLAGQGGQAQKYAPPAQSPQSCDAPRPVPSDQRGNQDLHTLDQSYSAHRQANYGHFEPPQNFRNRMSPRLPSDTSSPAQSMVPSGLSQQRQSPYPQSNKPNTYENQFAPYHESQGLQQGVPFPQISQVNSQTLQQYQGQQGHQGQQQYQDQQHFQDQQQYHAPQQQQYPEQQLYQQQPENMSKPNQYRPSPGPIYQKSQQQQPQNQQMAPQQVVHHPQQYAHSSVQPELHAPAPSSEQTYPTQQSYLAQQAPTYQINTPDVSEQLSEDRRKSRDETHHSNDYDAMGRLSQPALDVDDFRGDEVEASAPQQENEAILAEVDSRRRDVPPPPPQPRPRPPAPTNPYAPQSAQRAPTRAQQGNRRYVRPEQSKASTSQQHRNQPTKVDEPSQEGTTGVNDQGVQHQHPASKTPDESVPKPGDRSDPLRNNLRGPSVEHYLPQQNVGQSSPMQLASDHSAKTHMETSCTLGRDDSGVLEQSGPTDIVDAVGLVSPSPSSGEVLRHNAGGHPQVAAPQQNFEHTASIRDPPRAKIPALQPSHQSTEDVPKRLGPLDVHPDKLDTSSAPPPPLTRPGPAESGLPSAYSSRPSVRLNLRASRPTTKSQYAPLNASQSQNAVSETAKDPSVERQELRSELVTQSSTGQGGFLRESPFPEGHLAKSLPNATSNSQGDSHDPETDNSVTSDQTRPESMGSNGPSGYSPPSSSLFSKAPKFDLGSQIRAEYGMTSQSRPHSIVLEDDAEALDYMGPTKPITSRGLHQRLDMSLSPDPGSQPVSLFGLATRSSHRPNSSFTSSAWQDPAGQNTSEKLSPLGIEDTRKQTDSQSAPHTPSRLESTKARGDSSYPMASVNSSLLNANLLAKTNEVGRKLNPYAPQPAAHVIERPASTPYVPMDVNSATKNPISQRLFNQSSNSASAEFSNGTLNRPSADSRTSFFHAPEAGQRHMPQQNDPVFTTFRPGLFEEERISRQIPVFAWSSHSYVTLIPPIIDYGSLAGDCRIKVDELNTLPLVGLSKTVQKYPGPYLNTKGTPKTSKKDLEKWINDILEGEHAKDLEILWKLMLVLLKQDDKEYERRSIARILRPDLPEQANEPPLVSGADLFARNRNVSGENSNGPVSSYTNNIEGLFERLSTGNRDAALQLAIADHNWAHAICIAMSCGKDQLDHVIKEFVRSEIRTAHTAHSDQLAFTYRIFAGAGGAAVDELKPLRNASLHPRVDEAGYEHNLESWESYVATLLLNSSPGDELVLYELGKLLESRGKIVAGHFCLIASGLAPQGFPPVLVPGVSASSAGHELETLLLAEIYEYVLISRKTILQPRVPLLPYKAQLSLIFADLGLSSETQRVAEAALTLAKTQKATVFLDICEQATQRARNSASAPKGWITRKLTRPKLDKMWVSSFNKFVSGENFDEEAETDSQSSLVFSHTSGAPTPGAFGPSVVPTSRPGSAAGLLPGQTESPSPSNFALHGQSGQGADNQAYSVASQNPYALPNTAAAPGDHSVQGGGIYSPNTRTFAPGPSLHNNVHSSTGTPVPAPSVGYAPTLAPSRINGASSRQGFYPLGGDSVPEDVSSARYTPLNVAEAPYAPSPRGNVAPMPSLAAPMPALPVDAEAPARSQYKPVDPSPGQDIDDDDFTMSTSKPTKDKEEKEKEKEKEKDNEDQSKGKKKKGGWFGWMAKKEEPTFKAKLGEKNGFYYDDELKRWVDKNAGPGEQQSSLPPPPPKTTNRQQQASPAGGPSSHSTASHAMSAPTPGLTSSRPNPSSNNSLSMQAGSPSVGPGGVPAPDGGGPSQAPRVATTAARGDLDALLTNPAANRRGKKRPVRSRYVDVMQQQPQ